MDKSIIGTEMGGTTMEVERGKIMEFAKAILDESPSYFEDPTPMTPPTYSMAIAHWPAPATGGQGQQLAKLGLDLLRVLHAGQDFEYLGEIRAGDTLTTRSKIVDIYEKEGKRGGTMMFVKSETTFTNQRGEDVLKSTMTLVQTSKAAS
ncbi:MAG TPA: MaoC family dehydratase N-terminal domain-containing protein [Actinomycetota bacterium]|nr:MaoC family dehydratase N-terminal domain-containing protein [Actinomycetota bacterium]